jgi:hypothetical protein
MDIMNKTTTPKPRKPGIQKWTKEFIKKYKPALQELAKK